jgi:hypothetical protein
MIRGHDDGGIHSSKQAICSENALKHSSGSCIVQAAEYIIQENKSATGVHCSRKGLEEC